MKKLSLVLVCLGALLGVTAVAQASTTYFSGATNGKVVRPKTLYLTADGTLEVLKVSWKQWGGATAVGTGTADYHGCNPTCAQGKPHQRKVTVNLYDRETCKGRSYYNRVKLTDPSGRPLFQSFLRTEKWAPCKV